MNDLAVSHKDLITGKIFSISKMQENCTMLPVLPSPRTFKDEEVRFIRKQYQKRTKERIYRRSKIVATKRMQFSVMRKDITLDNGDKIFENQLEIKPLPWVRKV